MASSALTVRSLPPELSVARREVHPFDQPDVESAKRATSTWIERASGGAQVSAGERVGESDGVAAFSLSGADHPPQESVARVLERLIGELEALPARRAVGSSIRRAD